MNATMPLAFFGAALGAGEILLILVVILLLFGAERLPSLARTLGRTLEELRRSARELTRDLTAPPPPSANQPPAERPVDRSG